MDHSNQIRSGVSIDLEGITVLLIDGDKLVVQQISAALKSEGCTVKSVDSFKLAWVTLRNELPDVIVMEWSQPKQSGFEFLSELQANPQLGHILTFVLSAKYSAVDEIAAYNAGADHYVIKPFMPLVLTARVKALLRRMKPSHFLPAMTIGPVTLDPASHIVEVDNRKVELRPMGFKLLKFFLEHPHQAFARDEILEKVWGSSLNCDERTVDVYVMRLRKTLKNAGHLIKTLKKTGYMLTDR